MSRYMVGADETRAGLKREHLVIWSGPFCDVFEGWAASLPKGDGYMVTPVYSVRGKVRVTCPTPRTDDNFHEVDAAIDAALTAAWGDA